MAASVGTLLRSLPRPSLVPHSPFLHLRPLLEHMIVTSWLGSVHIFIRQYLNFLCYLYEEFDMFFSFKSLSVLSHLKQRSGSVFTTDSHNRIVALAELLPGLRRALCLGCSFQLGFCHRWVSVDILWWQDTVHVVYTATPRVIASPICECYWLKVHSRELNLGGSDDRGLQRSQVPDILLIIVSL